MEDRLDCTHPIAIKEAVSAEHCHNAQIGSRILVYFVELPGKLPKFGKLSL